MSNCIGRENANLRRIDDRGGECRTECAVVTDRIGPAREILGRELARPRLVDLPADRLGDADQGEAARVPHNWDNETVVIEVAHNAQIDITRKRQRLAVEPGVDLRIGGNRQTSRSRNERQKRQRESVRRLKSLLASFPHAIDRGEVDLDRLEYMRNRAPRLSEALPCLLPPRVQRDDVALPT